MSEIMGPEHPDFPRFRQLLREQIWPPGQAKRCPGGRDKPLTQKILKKHFPDIHVAATMRFFEDHGGYCDCEVLLNVNVI
jgi:hypothetical protein